MSAKSRLLRAAALVAVSLLPTHTLPTVHAAPAIWTVHRALSYCNQSGIQRPIVVQGYYHRSLKSPGHLSRLGFLGDTPPPNTTHAALAQWSAHGIAAYGLQLASWKTAPDNRERIIIRGTLVCGLFTVGPPDVEVRLGSWSRAVRSPLR